MTKKELFEMWKTRMLEYLREGGFNLEKNKELLEKIFKSAQNYVIEQN